MALEEDIRTWWQKALLGQQTSAHPVFGSGIEVQIDGDVVTISGTVRTSDEVEEIEREAQRLDMVKTVVNHLTATESENPYRMQTVLAVFRDEREAEMAREASAAWTVHENEPPDVFCRREEAEPALRDWARAAHTPLAAVTPYLDALDHGKVLLADRVLEDDCLRIISALEGTDAEMIRTLPPEPGEGE
jgi:hypothetical protein